MPRKARHRVIIDTNLWISFLLTKDFSKLDTFFSDEGVVLLFRQELLDEFVIVAGRPKLKKYFSLPDLEILLSRLNTKAKFIEVSSRVSSWWLGAKSYAHSEFSWVHNLLECKS